MKCWGTKIYTDGLTVYKCDMSAVGIFLIIQKEEFSYATKKTA